VLRYFVARTRNHYCTGNNNALCVVVVVVVVVVVQLTVTANYAKILSVEQKNACVVNLCYRQQRKLYVVFFEK
jgi:hypothetical protein